MALARHEVLVTDEKGNVVSGASVEVRSEVAGQPLASLFSDREGETPINNPTTTGSDGVAAFHAAGGAYQIKATKGAFSRTQRYVRIGTAGEYDIETILSLVGDVTGPESATDGQMVVFDGTSGGVIRGATRGSPPQPVTPDDFELADPAILRKDESADLEVGYTATSADQGTKSSGTFTPSFSTRGFQHCVNNGAFTLGVPNGHGTMILDITNGASAGAITTSAWGKVTGDSFTSTEGDKFRCYIAVGQIGAHLHVVAWQ